MKWLIFAITSLIAAMPVAAQEINPACAASTIPFSRRPPIRDFSGQLPIPDYLDAIIACNTPPQWAGAPGVQPPSAASLPSPWIQAERELYQGRLSGQKVDVLVVPLQVQGFGLDRIERSLMSADLAYAIGSTGQYTVADPWLVARALGDGMRTLDPALIHSLADSVGARKIIYGYVGHDDHHQFTLTLKLEVTPDNSYVIQRWQHDWRDVIFTDEQTPALKFHEMLPEILGALPLGLPFAHPATTETAPPIVPIEMTPHDLAASAKPSVSALTALVMLGSLTSPSAEQSRERLFEHAVLSALNSPAKGPEQNFLEAYAFFCLGRRPSALMLLSGDKTPQGKTLQALLDGNLPLAQEQFSTVKNSVERLLLQISLRDLQSAYNRKQDKPLVGISSAFGSAAPAWRPLIQLRMEDADQWSEGDASVIKALLDQAFPERNLDLNALEEGTLVARGSVLDPLDIDLANFRHVRRAAEHMSVSAFGTPDSLHLQPWDLLWLLEGRVEGRVIKHLEQQVNFQDLPQAALDDLAHYGPLLSGHPALESAHAQAAVMLADSGPDDVRSGWTEQALHSATLAAYWDPGQNQTAYFALLSMGVPSPNSKFMVDAYGHDYPRRPFWHAWFFGFEDPNRRSAVGLQALTFSSWDISPLSQIPPGDQPGHAGAVMASLGDRFTGNPHKPEWHGNGPAPLLDPQALEAKLRAAIKSDPEPWQNYWALGTLLVESSGKYQEASQALMSFPGFHNSNLSDPVALSNWAADAGTLFYRLGRFALANPFYKISADLDTGSHASMLSKQRLELVAGDYPDSIVELLERGSRYDDADAYRDYLAFLHAYGQHDVAWHAFEQLNGSFELPQVWASALVAYRMQGANDDTIREWLRRPEIRDAYFRTQRFAPYFAILWSATDGDAPADLGKLVEELQGPPVAHIGDDGVTLWAPHPIDPKNLGIVRASAFRAGKQAKLPPNTSVKSNLAFFADAYAALRSGDYSAAVSRFVAMADHYPIEGYPLAYFAYAAAKTDDQEHLEKYLDTLQVHPTFDYWLARAEFAAARHDTAGAMNSLQMAYRDRPSTDYRPIPTEYEYAESCERLYRETQDSRFISELLSWVQTIEVSQPTQAWAYAMQYTYSPPGDGRIRALAMTRYLDPKSKRIRNATDSELRAATEWFKRKNPFRLPTVRSKNARARALPYAVS
jgi:tetratricopeptide (TPR) repeat protein